MAPSGRGNSGHSITLATLALAALLGGPVVEAQFTSGVNAVEVYASVVDRNGEPVRGLTQEDFEVFEDGRPQALSAFAAGEFPLTVALAIDRSFSMAGAPLTAARSASRTFLEALRPEDEALVIAIGSTVEVIAGRTADRSEQIAAVDRLSDWGATKLYDAIVAAIQSVDGARGRRALVILSDGDDRYSGASGSTVVQRARGSNVMIFPIALGRARPPLFAELAALTGGRSYHARRLEELNPILSGIARELREQYLLGYTPVRPPVPGSNEWRSITVRVKRPGVTVRARDGYYVR